MHNYTKIYAPFKRANPKDKNVDLTLWQNSEIEFLSNLDWIWTEKIDGTTICICWDGDRVTIKGHSEKSQIPTKLNDFLTKTFLTSEAESIFESSFGEKAVTFFGEGISKETNKNYGFPDGSFVMFDIMADATSTYWTREAVESYAKLFNVPFVSVVFTGSISKAVEYVKTQPNSILDPTLKMEGLVGRPRVELKGNNGERLITKVKVCDLCK